MFASRVWGPLPDSPSCGRICFFGASRTEVSSSLGWLPAGGGPQCLEAPTHPRLLPTPPPSWLAIQPPSLAESSRAPDLGARGARPLQGLTRGAPAAHWVSGCPHDPLGQMRPCCVLFAGPAHTQGPGSRGHVGTLPMAAKSPRSSLPRRGLLPGILASWWLCSRVLGPEAQVQALAGPWCPF